MVMGLIVIVMKVIIKVSLVMIKEMAKENMFMLLIKIYGVKVQN